MLMVAHNSRYSEKKYNETQVDWLEFYLLINDRDECFAESSKNVNY